MPDYLPPCYWSSCAFSTTPTEVVHVHPFRNYRKTHQIKDTLPGPAVFTWPFRLSLRHSKNGIKRDGKYPPDWNQRADRFLNQLTKQKSLVFFYLNYDNPVSADEYKYALVGCARLTNYSRTGSYPFSTEELEKLRSRDGMQNFGAENWALKIQHDLVDGGVRLPYQEYLEHIAKSPEDENLLDEIKALIEEPALLPGVKYVSEHVNDDACLYLLYKLRRAFERVAEHGIASPGDALPRIDQFIGEFWAERGLYPGLASVLGIFNALRQGDLDWEAAHEGGIVASLRAEVDNEEELLKKAFALLSDKSKPAFLSADQIKILRQIRRGYQQYSFLEPVLRRLSLFDLTPRQIARVLFPDIAVNAGEPHPFSGRAVSHTDIAANPYLLCEEYVPTTVKESERSNELDREQRTDNPIDYFTIDIGLFPDEDHCEFVDDELLDFAPTGKERLRAFAVTTLRQQQGQGHTYAPLRTLIVAAQSHPLFYRRQLALNEQHFLFPGHLEHFKQRLFIDEVDGDRFFYLTETKHAEEIVGRLIQHLMDQPSHEAELDWAEDHLKTEAVKLAEIPGFSTELFIAERRKLIHGVMRQRLFLVTGRPGSGKTRALREVVKKLTEKGEKVTILAPTGKATLRVKTEAPDAEVETIDRWLSRSGLRSYLDNLADLRTMSRSKHYCPVGNLIIDESSMVDLARLVVVCRALEVHEPNVRRVIFVGDENQLPPIGMGRPLQDILDFLHRNAEISDRHVVRLRSNCRQRQDRTVIDAAYLFAGKNRYRTDLFQRLLSGGEISKHLRVEYWSSPDELFDQISDRLNALLELSSSSTDEERETALNLFLNLYETGYVKGYRDKKENELRVDSLQLLSPYRGGFSGALGLNQAIRERYRAVCYPSKATNSGGRQDSAFAHSEKIIRISNYYSWTKDDDDEWSRELLLSNGSIGILNNNLRKGRRAYFPDTTFEFKWRKSEEEEFEAAYAITVHKAQGSEFGEVFVVIPERRGLLSRELVYTAMTRSTGPMTLFVQRTERENPLEVARGRSDLLRRNSSLLARPLDARRVFEPEPGILVKSKVEYVIYEALRCARDDGQLTFAYELALELPFEEGKVVVHPDFTVMIGDRRFYWEHLGMLDRDDYFTDWQKRRRAYEKKGFGGQLVTSDDLHGICGERVQQIIANLVNGDIEETIGNEFSQHHYQLRL